MRRLAALVAAGSVLGGCAHTGVIDDGLNYAERQARLSALADWNLRGQLIIDTGERRERVRVAWEQRSDDLSLTVRGVVLGAGSFRIAGNAEQLVIEGRGESRILADPEIDLSREVGWWLPVTSLNHWLLGQPDTDYPVRSSRGTAGTLATLAQRDWQIVYREYQLANGLLVPREATLTHESLELRLTITEWQPTDAEP